MDRSKWILAGVGALTIAALMGGSLLYTNSGKAASVSASPVVYSARTQLDDEDETRRGRRRGDQPGEAFLAEALGISEEDLQAAQDAAFKAAVQQALDGGLITQAQAERLLKVERFPRFGLSALLVGPESGIEMDVLLASQLKISVEELQAAREKAEGLAIEQAVADGRITEEQAALMSARRAIRSAVDFRSIALSALGLTQDQLDVYRDDGLDRDAVLDKLGLTAEEARYKVQEAFQDAIQQAVSDGIITQEQADLLLKNLEDGFLPLFGGLRPGMRARGAGAMMPGGMDGNMTIPGGGMGPGSGGPNGGFQEGEPPMNWQPPESGMPQSPIGGF